MPPAPAPSEDTNAFTVLNHERAAADEARQPALPAPLPRNVNVVKPLQHAEPPRDLGMGAQPPHTILDPKFSRALDFKLRRLKEKEILLTNLRRPTRYRPKNGTLAASNPNVSTAEQLPGRLLSQSHPRINIIEQDNEKKVSPKMDSSPSPGRKTRSRNAALSSDGDKPRFVTTVKSGQFLLPPPEVARILGLETLYPAKERDKIVYSYASKPKAVAPRTKRSVPEKKDNPVTNGSLTERRRLHAGDVFSGVRALIAGVAGLRPPPPGPALVPAPPAYVLLQPSVTRYSYNVTKTTFYRYSISNSIHNDLSKSLMLRL